LKRAWTVAIVLLQAVGALPVLTLRKTKRRTPDSPPSDGVGSSTAGIEQVRFPAVRQNSPPTRTGRCVARDSRRLACCALRRNRNTSISIRQRGRMTRWGAMGLVADGQTKPVLLSVAVAKSHIANMLPPDRVVSDRIILQEERGAPQWKHRATSTRRIHRSDALASGTI